MTPSPNSTPPRPEWHSPRSSNPPPSQARSTPPTHPQHRSQTPPPPHRAATPTCPTRTKPPDASRTHTPPPCTSPSPWKRGRTPAAVRGWCARSPNDDAISRGWRVRRPAATCTRDRWWVCPRWRPRPPPRRRPGRRRRGSWLRWMPRGRSFPFPPRRRLPRQHLHPRSRREARPIVPSSARAASTPDSSPDRWIVRVDTWEAILPPIHFPTIRCGISRKFRTPANIDRGPSWDG
mmetsp:Transcript_3201/g.5842  ORF Transcript_3201/g.5842 Transcript_3201/m.5842 type:complete len:235 (-) Transcript_3201:803-1507(-)